MPDQEAVNAALLNTAVGAVIAPIVGALTTVTVIDLTALYLEKLFNDLVGN